MAIPIVESIDTIKGRFEEKYCCKCMTKETSKWDLMNFLNGKRFVSIEDMKSWLKGD